MDATSLIAPELEPRPIVPVVVVDDVRHAVTTAGLLLGAGIGLMEITLRSTGALNCIEAVAAEVPDIVVGAGSVRDVAQLNAAVAAGAQFAVSPGATDALLDEARRRSLPYLPGAATPSEMMYLLQRGYHLQKFFPAEAMGGVNTLAALQGPLPEVRFVPTGGISEANCAAYVALDNVAAVGGSWFVPANVIAAGDMTQLDLLIQTAAGMHRP